MFTHIEKASIKKFMEGKHKCTEITIISKSWLTFTFVYDTWLNAHRKGECNVFYEEKPMYFIDGNIISLNSEFIKMVKDKIGLPDYTNEELGNTAKKFIKRKEA